MNIAELRKKLAEYALTQDDSNKNEWYCTPRALAEGQVGRFIDWLQGYRPVKQITQARKQCLCENDADAARGHASYCPLTTI